jgi:hypothetical protein
MAHNHTSQELLCFIEDDVQKWIHSLKHPNNYWIVRDIEKCARDDDTFTTTGELDMNLFF